MLLISTPVTCLCWTCTLAGHSITVEICQSKCGAASKWLQWVSLNEWNDFSFNCYISKCGCTSTVFKGIVIYSQISLFVLFFQLCLIFKIDNNMLYGSRSLQGLTWVRPYNSDSNHITSIQGQQYTQLFKKYPKPRYRDHYWEGKKMVSEHG